MPGPEGVSSQQLGTVYFLIKSIRSQKILVSSQLLLNVHPLNTYVIVDKREIKSISGNMKRTLVGPARAGHGRHRPEGLRQSLQYGRVPR